MALSYLPHSQPANNDTRQMRRRVNDIVSTVSQQVGSIQANAGDLGVLNSTKANSTNPAITGTITQTSATTATSATAGAATALPATPLGYLQMVVNGTTVKIPYYAV